MYTLKQHKRKLKLRGVGPFVINEITPSGTVRLETLDGEPMANFINGSRLCVYHEPLTDDMLARMHAAGSRKQAEELMKQEALAEGRARAAAHRQQRLWIYKIQTSLNRPLQPPTPTIQIGVETSTNLHTAILNWG